MTFGSPPVFPAPSVPPDRAAQAIARLLAVLTEDTIFAIAAAERAARDPLDGMLKRREAAYTAAVQGGAVTRMTERPNEWFVEMTRVMAPVMPPAFLPMNDLLREKVTLEVGARGLRSLFSSKPSEKDVLRVKRLGTMAVRIVRAVLAADGLLDAYEERTLAALIGALGLPAEDATPLANEAPVTIAQLDVYGDVDQDVARALVRGGWAAAAWDGIDPREEVTIRAVADKLAVPAEEVEAARAEAIRAVDARRALGAAAVDAVRFVLFDRVPGAGVQIAAQVAELLVPKRYLDEVQSQVAAGAPVVLAKRHPGVNAVHRSAALGIAWAAALFDDPSWARRALLRARHDRFAEDIGDADAPATRSLVEAFVEDAMAPHAANMR